MIDEDSEESDVGSEEGEDRKEIARQRYFACTPASPFCN